MSAFMPPWLRKSIPAIKVVFTLAVLFFVGRSFLRDLARVDLRSRSLHPGWLGVSALFYIAGLGLSALFWYRLLLQLGQRPKVWRSVRAYYLGHFGKYLPGKAWALLLRATLARSPGVHAGVAGMTAFYEVLTTMAAGVLLSAVLLGWLGPETGTIGDRASLRRVLIMQEHDFIVLDREVLLFLSLALLAVVGLPIIPGVFNWLVHRLSLPFREPDSVPPRIGWRATGEGLILTAGGWLLLGISLWAVVRSLTGEALSWTWEGWARYSAYLSLAYVAGFVIVLIPSGLGVREYFLTVFLAPDLAGQLGLAEGEARAVAVLAVLLLRVIWTAAEAVVAGIVYWRPG